MNYLLGAVAVGLVVAIGAVAAFGLGLVSLGPDTASPPSGSDESSPSSGSVAEVMCASTTILLESLRQEGRPLSEALTSDPPIDRSAAERHAGIIALAGADVGERLSNVTYPARPELLVALRDAANSYAVYGLAVKEWLDAGAEQGDFDRRERLFLAGGDAADMLGSVRRLVATENAAGNLPCDGN